MNLRNVLQDGSDCYIRQRGKSFYGSGILAERGAYVLSRMLGLSVVPQTDLTLYKTSHQRRLVLSSIQDGIQGRERSRGIADTDSLVELYLYIVITNDFDKNGSNVMVEDASQRAFAIDNEQAGSHPTSYTGFPAMLTDIIDGRRKIPEKYRARLRTFLAQRESNREKLLAYFRAPVVDSMFQRAAFLLEHPLMLKPAVLEPLLKASVQDAPLPAPKPPSILAQFREFWNRLLDLLYSWRH
jgi:hypothetical protein